MRYTLRVPKLELTLKRFTKPPTIDEVDALYRILTGREPTPEDRAATEQLLAKDQAEEAPKPA